MATDAFGRLRVSDTYTLYEYYPPNVNSIEDIDESLDSDIWMTTVNGTSTYICNNATVELTCHTNGDKITRETKLPMEYQPGKSRLFYFSVIPLSRVNSGSEKMECNIGVFGVDDTTKNPVEGIYLQTDGIYIYFVYCYGGVETKIRQDSWNIDIFDGDGNSGKTIDINSVTKNLLIVIDQEWLGVGRVRCGFNIGGITYYGHEFIYSLEYPYISTPRLPIVYQLSGVTIDSSIVSKQVCCTCISEGGYTPIGKKLSLLTDNISTSGSNKLIIMGVRIKNLIKTGIVKILNFEVIQTGNSITEYELQLHSETNFTYGSVSAPQTFVGKNNSIIEYVEGDGSDYVDSDGFVISSGLLEKKSSITLSNNVYETLLVRNQITKYDTLYLVVKAGTNNIRASLNLLESY